MRIELLNRRAALVPLAGLLVFAVVAGCEDNPELPSGDEPKGIVLDEIILTPKSPEPGDTIFLTAVITSSGANVVEFPTVTWTVSDGVLLESSQLSVRWWANVASGLYTVDCRATNSVNSVTASTQVFVASPFYVKQARAGFEAVPQNLRLASATLGAGPGRTFLRVTVPLAGHALLAGAVMTWARALGEFGATLVFAGAFPGRTETMPVAIWTSSATNVPAAIALASTLVIVSFAVLIAAREIAGWRLRISLTP